MKMEGVGVALWLLRILELFSTAKIDENPRQLNH